MRDRRNSYSSVSGADPIATRHRERFVPEIFSGAW